tara:strand:- start:221 stop:1444 length:1224 start_codon:yes stop_codon:yes gene_type:complete
MDEAYNNRFVAALGLNPLCAGRMRLGHVVHHAFVMCDTHIGARPVIVSAAIALLELVHRPGALLEPPARFSPRAPHQWQLQHRRLVEFKKADARIQVLAVVLVGIVGMAREPVSDYHGIKFAIAVLARAQEDGRLPCELRAVMMLPHRASHVLGYDRDDAWYGGDALQDHQKMLAAARHPRPVWSAYYQTAALGLERQGLQHGGHLRWAEPDAVARGGAPPNEHLQAVAQRAARAASLGLTASEYESLDGESRLLVAPCNANAAYDAVHCRERFRRLDHDHPGFWSPRQGYMMTPMWHEHFPDAQLRMPAPAWSLPPRTHPWGQSRNSSAAGPAPGGSQPACPGRTSSSEPPGRGWLRQSDPGARRRGLCCLQRRREQKASEKRVQASQEMGETQVQGSSKRCRHSA